MSGGDGILQYARYRLKQATVRGILRRLVRWSPIAHPESGFTVLIGCSDHLMRMLPVNLEMLSRQEAPSLREVIVAIDRGGGPEFEAIARAIKVQFPTLPLTFLSYSPKQLVWAKRFNLAWVYSWMSWCLGIAATKTRYALLHDFDAMLIRPGILEDRYQAIKQRGDEYVGMTYYNGNGVVPDDKLVTTFELIFDAEFARRQLRPIDVFNNVKYTNGKMIKFDTFLYTQSRKGKISTLPIPVEEMVHPSQVITEFTELLSGRSNRGMGNCLFVAYFMFASNYEEPLRETVAVLESGQWPNIPFFGKTLDLSRLTEVHTAWIVKQVATLETAMVGEVRPLAREFINAITAFTQRPLARAEPAGAKRNSP